MKLFGKIAGVLYDAMNQGERRGMIAPQVTADLGRLYPGVEREKLQRDYYVSKLEKAMLVICVGTVLAVLLGVRARTERKMDPANVIVRGGFADQEQELKIETKIGEIREQFQIRVPPRQMKEKEAEELYMEFIEKLPSLIRGENGSLMEVEHDLALEEQFEGYPFAVDWKSSNVDVVTSSGAVENPENACTVVLTADITYEELAWQEELQVRIMPQILTAEEKQHKDLEDALLKSELDSRAQEQWDLPQTWQEESIIWSRSVEDYSLILGAAVLIVAVLIYFFADKDLHDEVERKKAKMRMEYPDIVHKLVLYLGAGLTLRGAFQKIAAEYEQGRKGGRAKGAAYEEMLYTCRELQAGVSELQAYERFGKRTGLQEYIRLTTLLTQNLKKGSSTLLKQLREEADRASLERIQNSKKMGEEASTKLLVPMVMMLGVVMVMVMLPALTNMGK